VSQPEIAKNALKPLIFGVQGCSRSSMLVPLESSSAVLVMISSKSVSWRHALFWDNDSGHGHCRTKLLWGRVCPRASRSDNRLQLEDSVSLSPRTDCVYRNSDLPESQDQRLARLLTAVSLEWIAGHARLCICRHPHTEV